MSSSPASKGRILLGEDVRSIAHKMSEALQGAGYQVDIAADGQDCLRKAEATRPDLLILDIMMPKLHGIEVLKALRKNVAAAQTGVLICTVKDFQVDQKECDELGVAGYLVKPIKVSDLLKKVQTFFARDGKSASGIDSGRSSSSPGIYKPRLDTELGSFSLWGCRGSTPTPGARFLRHGGNTSCLSVSYHDELFIFDAGSGIRDLGLELLAGPKRRLYLFVTHTHWDHIQGFPFFGPNYVPGFEIIIYGAEGFGKDLESVFRGQLDRDYFPVQMEDMRSSLQFRHLDANPIVIGDVKVWWEYAQHPGATVGYKIEMGERNIAWVPDNEFLQGYLGPPGELTREHPFVSPYRKMIDFLTDVDVLIHEAQYTNDEYPTKIGWGHCCVSNACVLMTLANVRRWIVTHHDPLHDDAFLEGKLNITRQILANLGHSPSVSHGYDGLCEQLV